ncbi:hypothetical protein HDC34_001814 [Pseudoclavibacter sp. JAI123]|uniref:hypothetical protein n=1 Tax=Pseudoclavibacter sp. JAI123 TaxID=2723065 RepID=UPI0015CC6E86|nr:hypothetical protein [Pseudoclavibacter sp. JAI123]NYF13520.1 hypothetical protein [Pseudoclavibacter sp. JAI123]
MTTTRGFDHEVYAGYLNAHLLASEAGLRAFKSATATWAGTPHEETMRVLVAHIAADRRDLKTLIEGLGYQESFLKLWLTNGARLAGTFNPVNILRLRRRPSTQLELDMLTGMVRAKLSMWEALIAVQPRDPRLVLSGLEELLARSQAQIDLLQGISQDSVEERFLEQASRDVRS